MNTMEEYSYMNYILEWIPWEMNLFNANIFIMPVDLRQIGPFSWFWLTRTILKLSEFSADKIRLEGVWEIIMITTLTTSNPHLHSLQIKSQMYLRNFFFQALVIRPDELSWGSSMDKILADDPFLTHPSPSPYIEWDEFG